MTRLFLLIVAVGFLSASVSGQSINIDHGMRSGTPGPDYAAAGLPGVWNAPAADPGSPQALVGLTGRPVGATVVHDVGFAFSIDDPGGPGEIRMTLSFGDLLDGTYEVMTYAWTPEGPGEPTLVTVNGDPASRLIAGGTWPGDFEAEVTHVIHEVEVTDGALSIAVQGASGLLNGVQLRRLTPADLDDDGIVGVSDFLTLLALWGPCPDPCPADLDTDGEVDLNDVLILLGSWG
ncbi:MAG: hypothetical protein ACYSWT_02600 [Planctomycetota bacterium]|jgi:hypothetical protein